MESLHQKTYQLPNPKVLEQSFMIFYAEAYRKLDKIRRKCAPTSQEFLAEERLIKSKEEGKFNEITNSLKDLGDKLEKTKKNIEINSSVISEISASTKNECASTKNKLEGTKTKHELKKIKLKKMESTRDKLETVINGIKKRIIQAKNKFIHDGYKWGLMLKEAGDLIRAYEIFANCLEHLVHFQSLNEKLGEVNYIDPDARASKIEKNKSLLTAELKSTYEEYLNKILNDKSKINLSEFNQNNEFIKRNFSIFPKASIAAISRLAVRFVQSGGDLKDQFINLLEWHNKEQKIIEVIKGYEFELSDKREIQRALIDLATLSIEKNPSQSITEFFPVISTSIAEERNLLNFNLKTAYVKFCEQNLSLNADQRDDFFKVLEEKALATIEENYQSYPIFAAQLKTSFSQQHQEICGQINFLMGPSDNAKEKGSKAQSIKFFERRFSAFTPQFSYSPSSSPKSPAANKKIENMRGEWEKITSGLESIEEKVAKFLHQYKQYTSFLGRTYHQKEIENTRTLLITKIKSGKDVGEIIDLLFAADKNLKENSKSTLGAMLYVIKENIASRPSASNDRDTGKGAPTPSPLGER